LLLIGAPVRGSYDVLEQRHTDSRDHRALDLVATGGVG
jgi:hypothetical protein